MQVSRQHTFNADTPALAEEVNQEFDNLISAVNNLEIDNIPALEALLGITFQEKDTVSAGSTNVIARFTTPTDKKMNIIKASLALSNDGTQSTAISLQVYNFSTSSVIYTTNSATLLYGDKLGQVPSGTDVGIQVVNTNTANSYDYSAILQGMLIDV